MVTNFVPQVAVVDFNHHRGPEIEFWLDNTGKQLFEANEWSSLPFLALPDGAHATEEEFSYFTLHNEQIPRATETSVNRSSIFGVSCTRQIRADKLKNKSPEVTRSTVQKAIVVLVDKPSVFVHLRDRLASIAAAWFAQEDFTNIEILKAFQSSLEDAAARPEEREHYFGLSLRDLVYELRWQTLVLFKCILLQKRILFFGTKCERLCMAQFALVSLVPGLLDRLQDCSHPSLDTYSNTATRVDDLKASDRSSLLAYMGLPLHVFGKGSFFSPYTPLQQLDMLNAPSSRSYVAGSTNTLFLSQRETADNPSRRYCDVLVNFDEANLGSKVAIVDPGLRSALTLSAADRRWIDHMTLTVIETWNPDDPSRPTTHGYTGSEDAIRLSFEEYILSLLSSTAYKNHFDNHPNPYLSSSGGGVQDERYPDPAETANDFNSDYLRIWRDTQNYELWHRLTADASFFDLVEPRHPTAGGLNIEDVQRRVGAAVAELHLDERTRQARESAGKAFEISREKVGAGITRFWKEVDNFKDRREQSRGRRATEKEKENDQPLEGVDNEQAQLSEAAASPSSWASRWRDTTSKMQRPNVDSAQIQAAARENAAKAGAYLSSWGTWAKERGKEWNDSRNSGPQTREVAGSGDVSPQPGIQRQVSMGAVAAAKSAMGKEHTKNASAAAEGSQT